MTRKELIEALDKAGITDNFEIITSSYNGHVCTYGILDEVYNFNYQSLSNDFFGTPGRMDKRLFEIGRNMSDDYAVCYLGSSFGQIPNKDVDCGSDDINYSIKTVNGKDGDPELVFKLSGFEKDAIDEDMYIKFFGEKEPYSNFVSYNMKTDELRVEHTDKNMFFHGTVTGLEDLRNILRALRVPFPIIA